MKQIIKKIIYAIIGLIAVAIAFNFLNELAFQDRIMLMLVTVMGGMGGMGGSMYVIVKELNHLKQKKEYKCLFRHC